MKEVEKHIKTWLNFPMLGTSTALKNEVLEKTEFTINTGLSDHHTCFCYVDIDGCLYYLEYFSKGWKKRRPNKEGWVKFLNASALNIHTKERKGRWEIFG